MDHFVSETEDLQHSDDDVLPDGCEPVTAAIPGSVWKVIAEEGQRISEGETIAVLESMKMEFPVESEYNGIVEKVFIKTSQQINAGQMIAAVKTEE